MEIKGHLERISNHYIGVWGNTPSEHQWDKGPINELPQGFKVLKFKPTKIRNRWIYATCGMSLPSDISPLELHIFAPEANDRLIELLTIITHYHRTGSFLNCGHTVNFGQPWWRNSKCEYGLISLPYLDGPILEWMKSRCEKVRFLWIVPITKEELEYKKKFGYDVLEEQFENMNIDYLDPYRVSVI